MSATVNLFELERLPPGERDRLRTRAEADLSAFLGPAERIIDQVREGGDEAVARLGRELDGAEGLAPGRLTATEAEFDRAFREVAPEVREASNGFRTSPSSYGPWPFSMRATTNRPWRFSKRCTTRPAAATTWRPAGGRW
jgi:hypothetical protein